MTQVQGTITFEKEFFEDNKDLILNYLNNKNIGRSGIDYIDQTAIEGATIPFSADLAYCRMRDYLADSLQLGFSTSDGKFLEFYNALLSSKHNQIKFDYLDYANGISDLYGEDFNYFVSHDRWLIHETATVIPLGQPRKEYNDEVLFKTSLTNAKVLPINDYYLVDNCYEQGLRLDKPDELKIIKGMLKDQLFKKLKKDYDRKPTVEELQTEIDKMINFIKTDSDYQGGLCDYRYDQGCFYEQMNLGDVYEEMEDKAKETANV